MSPAITSITVLIDRMLHILDEKDLQLPPAFQSLSLEIIRSVMNSCNDDGFHPFP